MNLLIYGREFSYAEGLDAINVDDEVGSICWMGISFYHPDLIFSSNPRLTTIAAKFVL